MDRRLKPLGPPRALLALLAVAVLLLHGAAGEVLSERMRVPDTMPRRIAVTYARVLEPAAPPAAAAAVAAPAPAAAAPPAARPRVARGVAGAASAPSRAATAAAGQVAATAAPARTPEADTDVHAAAAGGTVVAATPAAEAAPDPAVPPAAAGASAGDAAAPATPPARAASDAALPGAPPFAWPESTRLTYRLVGEMRGEVHGSAEVEWVRIGNVYQVHFDVTVGLAVAPLVRRRMTSAGELGDAGLVPRRYDEETKVMFAEGRRATVRLDADGIVLAGGERRPRPPGVQDTASQFIQLAWLFAHEPALLRAGTTIEVPLALPRHVSPWSYQVVGEDTVHTAFGALPVVHLQPRRTGRRGDLSVEMWVAPTLRYLPVRIRIRQDAQTWVELEISRPPELAAEEPAPR